jgi:hypothetical protein
MPSDDSKYWPKHVKAKWLLTSFKLIILDELPLFIYILKGATVHYKNIR